jgi:hypothetical protein
MADREYVFRCEWRVPGAPRRVYDVLADVEAYPRWWPQIRLAQRLDGDSGQLVCRSLLPYDVTLVMHRDLIDPVALVLRARLSGDLIGTSQWTVRADGDGSRAIFDERVVVGTSMLRAAGRIVRPALRFNHDLMMRGGERGLRGYLRSGA